MWKILGESGERGQIKGRRGNSEVILFYEGRGKEGKVPHQLFFIWRNRERKKSNMRKGERN